MLNKESHFHFYMYGHLFFFYSAAVPKKSQNDDILHPFLVFNTLTFQYLRYTGTNVYFICKNNVQKSLRIATIFHPILIVLVHMCLIVVDIMLHIRCTIKMVIIIMYFLCFLSNNFGFGTK